MAISEWAQDESLGRRLLRIGIVVGATLIVFPLLGINIFTALPALYRGTIANPYSLAQVMALAAVLTLTAAAALVPFRAGFVNLGGEGQLTVGATATTCVVLVFGEPGSIWILLLAVVAGAVAGAAWGGIASTVFEKYGANEVITTLMLNFIAFAVADFVIANVWPDKLAPQTVSFPDGTAFPSIGKFEASPYAVAVALAAWIFVTWLISRTNFGFRLKATGENAIASLRFGYAPVRTRVISVLIGGALAGVAGSILVLVVNRALNQGISQSYGYIGIAAALLVGLRPALLPLGAIAFALIAVGGNTLAAVSRVSPSVSLVGVSACVLVLLATRRRNSGGGH